MPTTSLHGRGGAVYLGTLSAAAVSIAAARSWKFDMDHELIENTQGYGGAVASWKEYILAVRSWTGTIEGNLDTAQATPWLASTGPLAIPLVDAPVALYLYPDRTNTARFYSGNIWPKLSVDARIGSVIRFTMDFTGNGALSQT